MTRPRVAWISAALMLAAVVALTTERRTAAVHAAAGTDGCVTASPRAAAFPLDAKRPLPLCRHAAGGTLDVPLSGRKAGGFDPDPGCGAYDPAKSCIPSAYQQGNARIHRVGTPGRLVAVSDSFGKPFAYVRAVTSDCFDVFDAGQRRVGSTDPRRDSSDAGCDAAQPSTAPVAMDLQGRGCMATQRLSQSHVLVALVRARGSTAAPHNTGLRGFVSVGAVSGGLSALSRQHLREADPGCGRASGSSPPPGVLAGGQLRSADSFVSRVAPGGPATLDSYVSPNNLRCVDNASTCAGFYANYQGPCYAPDVALLAVSTTGVSGVGTTREDNPGALRTGGVVRAVVRRDAGPGSFKALDAMGSADVNVPRAQGPVATWVFGDANPNADAVNAARPGLAPADRQQHIYGWTPVRHPQVSRASYAC